MSGISRAFTTKRNVKKSEISGTTPQGTLTTKHSFPGSVRMQKISGPVELLSTTNMLSYNAPDLYPSSTPSSSGDDYDSSPTSASSPLQSSSSSIETTPSSPEPEPNHLSCYFGTTSRQSASSDEAPMIPQRALSHTKRSTEILAHRRHASSRMSSSKGSLSTVRSSINIFNSNIDFAEQHPFGNELAQVSELAEEYGISEEKMAVVDSEEKELIARGLLKFRADEYISEIQGLFLGAFAETKPIMSPMWI